jgi:hypothetical protein
MIRACPPPLDKIAVTDLEGPLQDAAVILAQPRVGVLNRSIAANRAQESKSASALPQAPYFSLQDRITRIHE